MRADGGSALYSCRGRAKLRGLPSASPAACHPVVIIAALYGQLTPAEQDRAVQPAPAGQRKIVLATSIAETSLTIQGVRIVIDSGYRRVPAYEPATGLTTLETVRVSKAGADQRRGRAGRTEPGICYRLWGEGQTAALAQFDRPEMLEADLAVWRSTSPPGASPIRGSSSSWTRRQACLGRGGLVAEEP